VFEDGVEDEEEQVEEQAKPQISELVIPTNINELAQKK